MSLWKETPEYPYGVLKDLIISFHNITEEIRTRSAEEGGLPPLGKKCVYCGDAGTTEAALPTRIGEEKPTILEW